MEFSAYKLVYNFVNKPESYMELKARNVKEFVLEQPTILAFDGYTAVVQPLDRIYSKDTQLNTLSVINNLPNSIDKTSDTTQVFQIVNELSKPADRIAWNKLSMRTGKKKEQIPGVYKYKASIEGLNAVVDVPAFNTVQILPLGTVQYIQVDKRNLPATPAQSSVVLLPWKGYQHFEEPLYACPALVDNMRVGINIYGKYTGYSYQYHDVQDGTDILGMKITGRTQYLLVKQLVEDHPVLVEYDLVDKTTAQYAVYYTPVDPQGIQIADNFLIVYDGGKAVILEKVDTRYTVEDGYYTFNYPLKGFTSEPVSPYTFTDAIDIEKEKPNVQLVEVEDMQATLFPTIYDSMQQLAGFDRKDFEPLSQLVKRIVDRKNQQSELVQDLVPPSELLVGGQKIEQSDVYLYMYRIADTQYFSNLDVNVLLNLIQQNAHTANWLLPEPHVPNRNRHDPIRNFYENGKLQYIPLFVPFARLLVETLPDYNTGDVAGSFVAVRTATTGALEYTLDVVNALQLEQQYELQKRITIEGIKVEKISTPSVKAGTVLGIARSHRGLILELTNGKESVWLVPQTAYDLTIYM